MTSSTKPEVHNVCGHRTIEPRQQVTCTENLVNKRDVFETCERTDKQTDTLTIILRTLTGDEIIGRKNQDFRLLRYHVSEKITTTELYKLTMQSLP